MTTKATTHTTKLIKLKQQQERIRQQIAAEQRRISTRKRKDDTRRKILDGALIQEEAENNQTIAKLLERLRREKLTRHGDRALFGLDPLPETKAQEKPKTAAQN